MTENEPTADDSRRNFLKGAAATGMTATGLLGLSGSASAQQNVRNLQLDVQEVVEVEDGNNLLNLQVQNVNVLRNVNVQDVVVTVIGGDLRILEEGIDIEDSLIEINNNDIDVNVLNDSVVQVAVAVLGENDDVVAAGDTLA